MEAELPIMWGWEKPEHIRSKEHRKFLIERYNENRPEEEHVHTMSELNRALLDNEIEMLKSNA
tara:strand:+ start:278 stop:466 length:189 start_codon:yes stop_codon:yes gene_type:complete